MSTSFDDVGQEYSGVNRDAKPIWAFNLDDPQEESNILSWLKGEKNYLKQEWQEYNETCRRFHALYRGVQYDQSETRQSLRDREADKTKVVKKFSVNLLYDFVENLVARQVKYKPGVQVLPMTGEYEDKLSAKVAKNVVDDVWYRNSFENTLFPSICKLAKQMKEAFLFIEWNKDLGELHPDYKADKKIPMLDEHGARKLDDQGNPVFIDSPVHVGDTEYSTEYPENIFPQKAKVWADTEYLFRKRKMNTALLRVLHPDKASQIKDTQDHWYDFLKFEEVQLQNECIVWEFYHKSTRPMDKGRQILFTEECILSNTPLKYDHGKLPLVRMVDIDIPNEQRGESFINFIKSLTGVYSNYTNMINRALILASQAKWVMPVGSAKVEALGNDHTIVQYKGPIAPQLVKLDPISPSLFMFRKDVKEEVQQLAGVFGVSRGEPPAGIKAGVALQFLNEQEEERSNSTIVITNEFVKQVAAMTLSVASQYYDESDKRIVRIMGSSSKYAVEMLDVKHLGKQFDIRIQNSSALPQSKAARVQTILDISQQFPDLLPREQIVELLDIGSDQEFYNAVTAAVRAAEAENEAFLNGDKVAPPAQWEDLIMHWNAHAKLMQEYSFKKNTPPEIVKAVEDHMLATEMMMADKASKSQAFAQALSTLVNFPMVYELPPPPPVMGPQPPLGAPPMPGDQGIPQQGMPASESQPPMPFQEPAQEQNNVPPPAEQLGGEPYPAPVQLNPQ